MAMKTQSTSTVDVLTGQGMKLFHEAKLKEAVIIFEDAYRQATQLNDSCECDCAFNLGAVYIANHEPDKGLAMLNNVWKVCGNVDDGTLKADLYYNYGLAYELQKKEKEAVNYLELALETYQSQPDKTLTMADLAAKIADMYTGLGNAPQAAKSHQVAAALYAQMEMSDKHVIQLCKEASQLFLAGREKRAKEVADSCMTECQNIRDKDKLGRIYNELGLIYSQCLEFAKAATCFELALPPDGSTPGDIGTQAVIRQNLGATYNTLHQYEKALAFHKQAATQYAEQGNRKAQGKCFLNLAYAYSQLGQHDDAGEFYLHALQAARDTDSQHDQWQAMEGVGVVAFHENRLHRAEKYFTMALDTLKAAPEATSGAWDRITKKLQDVRGERPAQLLLNDLTRPPTREERQQMKEQREWGRVQKVERPFEVVARGIGEYVSDSDSSFNHHSHTRREWGRVQKVERPFEVVARGIGEYVSDSDSSFNHHSHTRRSRRHEREQVDGYDEVDYRPASHWSTRVQPQTFREDDTSRTRRRSRRHEREQVDGYDEVDYRPASHWSTRVQPQTFREDDTSRTRRSMRRDGHRSDTAVSYQHRHSATQHRTMSERRPVHSQNRSLRSFSAERRVCYDNPQSSDDDYHLRRHGNRQSERSRREHARNPDEETSCDDQCDPRRSGVMKRASPRLNSDSCDSRRAIGSDEDLARYADQLGMEESEEVTDSEDEEEDSEGQTSDPREEPTAQPRPQEDSSRYLPAPPPVPKHTPPSSRKQLNVTYEKPISGDQLADGQMAGNYFSVQSANSKPEVADHVASSVPGDGGATYATINSMNRTSTSVHDTGDVMPSTSHEMAPPVPHRNSDLSSSNKSTGLPYDPNDPEIRELHLDSQLGQEREDDGDPLIPTRKKSKRTTSNMCTVM